MHDAVPLILVTGGSGFIGSSFVRRSTDRFRMVGLHPHGSPKANAAVESCST
jgi:nucleoside-diphosphate-sugar epimerase